MQHLAKYIFGLLVLIACTEPQNNTISTAQGHTKSASSIPNIPTTYDKYFGIGTINCGPRGEIYVNSSGKSFPYRIFRVQIINDTVCPMELKVSFPDKPVPQYPDTTQSIKVFLFPDALTPDTIQDVYNFGIRGLESFLDTGLNKPTTLTKLIQPKGEYILYIGCLTDGLARAKFFINGQDPGLTFLQDKSVVTGTKNKNMFDLVFGVGINPPKNHTLIHCGQIVFKKRTEQ